MDIARFKKLPILGILRGGEPDEIEPLIRSVISAGLEAMEITMDSKDAGTLIRKAKSAAGTDLMIGAGTVLNMDLLKIAVDAGATFIVMPTLIEDVMEYCVKNVIPVFPGALTPQEIGDLKKLRGGERYYRIRLGEYRIGLILEGDKVVFVRFLPRKDIYRYFP